eukprot:gene8074-8154_t
MGDPALIFGHRRGAACPAAGVRRTRSGPARPIRPRRLRLDFRDDWWDCACISCARGIARDAWFFGKVLQRAAIIEPVLNPSGLGELAMEAYPKSLLTLVRTPGGYMPIAMSLCALAIVVSVVAVHGAVRDPDEGAAAHVFQLLIAAQCPILGFFAANWMAKDRTAALSVMAIQMAAIALALLPNYGETGIIFALGYAYGGALIVNSVYCPWNSPLGLASSPYPTRNPGGIPALPSLCNIMWCPGQNILGPMPPLNQMLYNKINDAGRECNRVACELEREVEMKWCEEKFAYKKGVIMSEFLGPFESYVRNTEADIQRVGGVDAVEFANHDLRIPNYGDGVDGAPTGDLIRG